MSQETILLFTLAPAALGVLFGYILRKLIASKKSAAAEGKAQKILSEADVKSQKIIIEAQQKSLKMIEESKQEDENRRKELRGIQQKLEKIENDYRDRVKTLERKEEDQIERHKQFEEAKLENHKKLEEDKSALNILKEEQIKQLEGIAKLTHDEAKDVLMKTVEDIENEAFMSRLHKLEREHSDELEKKARGMLSLVIQRYASSHVVDTTTSAVSLPSDEMKGRIIGKEGRNIKAIEQLTGTEIIVDDTPETITISGFSPIRRQVAKIALQKLIEDGRIQPTKIEEAVELAKKELAIDIKKAGEDALYEMGIPLTAFDPKLIQILGRLKYRTSYGQNVLKHSMEVATLSAMLAQELGADVTICKRGGILHDIGKAVDHDVQQGSHPELGYNIMKKFGLPEEICYQSIGHHEDRPKTLEAVIVKAADAISGARPGARRDTYELYVQRLEELEKTATDFPGVEKAYAIQAGREIRVFVSPKIIDDFGAYKLAKDIAKKIEAELKHPGDVKVTVIRETRVIEYAR